MVCLSKALRKKGNPKLLSISWPLLCMKAPPLSECLRLKSSTSLLFSQFPCGLSKNNIREGGVIQRRGGKMAPLRYTGELSDSNCHMISPHTSNTRSLWWIGDGGQQSGFFISNEENLNACQPWKVVETLCVIERVTFWLVPKSCETAAHRVLL